MHQSRISTVALVSLLATLPLLAATSGDRDILGRPVPMSAGRPTIVVYANRATGDPIQKALADVSVRLAEIRPVVVVRVDLRDLPGLFKGFAASRIKTRYTDGIKLYESECQRLGVAANPHPQDSLFFVSDENGQPHQTVGLAPGFHEAVAVAYDAEGQELIRVPFPKGADLIERSVRAAAR